jgi:hypothetical protein
MQSVLLAISALNSAAQLYQAMKPGPSVAGLTLQQLINLRLEVLEGFRNINKALLDIQIAIIDLGDKIDEEFDELFERPFIIKIISSCRSGQEIVSNILGSDEPDAELEKYTQELTIFRANLRELRNGFFSESRSVGSSLILSVAREAELVCAVMLQENEASRVIIVDSYEKIRIQALDYLQEHKRETENNLASLWLELIQKGLAQFFFSFDNKKRLFSIVRDTSDLGNVENDTNLRPSVWLKRSWDLDAGLPRPGVYANLSLPKPAPNETIANLDAIDLRFSYFFGATLSAGIVELIYGASPGEGNVPIIADWRVWADDSQPLFKALSADQKAEASRDMSRVYARSWRQCHVFTRITQVPFQTSGYGSISRKDLKLPYLGTECDLILPCNHLIEISDLKDLQYNDNRDYNNTYFFGEVELCSRLSAPFNRSGPFNISSVQINEGQFYREWVLVGSDEQGDRYQEVDAIMSTEMIANGDGILNDNNTFYEYESQIDGRLSNVLIEGKARYTDLQRAILRNNLLVTKLIANSHAAQALLNRWED